MPNLLLDINAKFDGLQNNNIKKRKACGHGECD